MLCAVSLTFGYNKKPPLLKEVARRSAMYRTVIYSGKHGIT